MEKYLRLLNPKSINYEADRIDGGSPALTAQDVLLAMGFARLSPFQDVLIRLKYFEANTQANVNKFAQILASKYEQQFSAAGVNHIYHYSIALIGLTEFCMVPASYKPSERARAAICGFSDTTVRNHMKRHIQTILEDLNMELHIGEHKIFTQLIKTK